jgi:hypothetical protein
MRICSLLLSVVLLTSAGCTNHHVQFFFPNTVADAPDEVRIFMDARGDLYPDDGIAAGYALPDGSHGSLFEAARGGDPALCLEPRAGSELEELCDAVDEGCYGSVTTDCFARWQMVQETMWKRRAERIAARFGEDGRDTIGVLIYGFNNWFRESDANYATAEREMRRFLPADRKIGFVEVYWDGCRGNDQGIGCWSRAQSTGPLAGFALRRLFNGVEEAWTTASGSPSWRVLTHSSGAFVAGATFGDPTIALPQLQDPTTNRWYGRFARHRDEDRGPDRIPQLSDARLGMFAPATPSSTFGGQSRGVLSQNLTILTVVQPDDSALNKLVLGCRRLGASCLGAIETQACDLKRELEGRGTGITLSVYDFGRPEDPWGDERELHDYSVYVRQAADHSTFFRDFLGSDPRATDASPLIDCG